MVAVSLKKNFFKQKTAYEITTRLVGSEMCIRDSFLDLQKKCDSAEISTKALDLRGMLDALRLMRRGVAAGAALDMGITNKAFDSYEQGLIRDAIAARIPAQLTAAKLFG